MRSAMGKVPILSIFIIGFFAPLAIAKEPIPPSVKKVIGLAGGTIVLQGTINRVELSIPPGALAADTEITARQVPTPPSDLFAKVDTPIGNTFSFEPHDLPFLKMATITFAYRDKDLPPHTSKDRKILVYTDGSGGLFGIDGGAQCDPAEPPGPHCTNTESYAQHQDVTWDTVGGVEEYFTSVFINKLSRRQLLVFSGAITGCNGTLNAKPLPVAVKAEGFSVPILRCLRPDVKARPATAQIAKIVIHSTDNGGPLGLTREFKDEIKGCAISKGCKFFAHYYIDRDGSIMQVVEDSNLALHTLSNTDLNVSNSNSIGIVLATVAEYHYDGRQLTALVRLIDILIRLHPTIRRPTFPRRLPITSANTLLNHAEVDPDHKRDPTGIFRASNVFFYTVRTTDPITKSPRIEVVSKSLGGNALDATRFDGVVSEVAALGRNVSGSVNRSGGDSLNAADGGSNKDIYYGSSCPYYAAYVVDLHILGWSPQADYFAFGYNWHSEAGLHINAYILNSKQNTFKWKMEQTIDEDTVSKEQPIRSAIGAELKKLGIFNGTQLYRYDHDIPPSSIDGFSSSDKVSFQIKGRPYHLKLNNQYKEDESHPAGQYAKFELLLVNEDNQKVHVLQRDKTFFRRAWDYAIEAVYLSPEEDYIAVIIGQWEYVFEGLSATTFLGVTGKIEM